MDLPVIPPAPGTLPVETLLTFIHDAAVAIDISCHIPGYEWTNVDIELASRLYQAIAELRIFTVAGRQIQAERLKYLRSEP